MHCCSPALAPERQIVRAIRVRAARQGVPYSSAVRRSLGVAVLLLAVDLVLA